MMNREEYKYDVAFSFLGKDETLAFQLYKILNGPISCFIYSEEQKRLAGKDGEAEFNKVFGEESRSIVVLYRENWGSTPWTRIEETAIRNRAHDEGYDFVLFIPMGKVSPPKWLPKNRIWIGLERWGIEKAAVVIEARVQELDGQIKILSIEDKAQMASIEVESKKKREAILKNPEGLLIAKEEFQSLISKVKEEAGKIGEVTPKWHIRLQNNTEEGIDVISYGYYLSFKWYSIASNTPEGTYFRVSFYDGIFDERGHSDAYKHPKLIADDRLQFDINELDQYGWSKDETRKNFQTTDQIVEDWFDRLIVRATNKRKKDLY